MKIFKISVLITITLLMLGCDDECEATYERWRKIDTQSISRSTLQNFVINDGDMTAAYNERIFGSITLGNPCLSPIVMTPFYVTGDFVPRDSIKLQRVLFTVYGTVKVTDSTSITKICENTEYNIEPIENLMIVKVCHYGADLNIDKKALSFHLSHGDIENSCQTLSDPEFYGWHYTGSIVVDKCGLNKSEYQSKDPKVTYKYKET